MSVAVMAGMASGLTAQSLSLPLSDANHPRNVVVATVAVGTDPNELAVSPDSAFVYVPNSGSNNVSVINTGTNQVTATVPVGNVPTCVAITPDNKVAYVSNFADGTVSLIAVASNRVIETLTVGTGPEGLAVNPKGNQVYVTNFVAGTVSVIETATNQVSATINVGGKPALVNFTSTGSQAYVVNEAGTAFILKIDTSTRSVIDPFVGSGVVYYPEGLAIAPDNETLYVTDLYNFLAAINAVNGALIKPTLVLPIQQQVKTILLGAPAITPDGKYLYVANAGESTVVTVATATGDLTGAPIPVGKEPLSLAAAPAGKYLYVANFKSGSVTVIDIGS
jgi:YVTN family beta-propeller protein